MQNKIGLGGATRAPEPHRCGPFPGPGSSGVKGRGTQPLSHAAPSRGRRKPQSGRSLLPTHPHYLPRRGSGTSGLQPLLPGTAEGARQWRFPASGPSPLLNQGSRSPHLSGEGGVRMSAGLPPLGSSLPEGCARGPPKGLRECGLRCPFPELFFSATSLLESLSATPGDRIS